MAGNQDKKKTASSSSGDDPSSDETKKESSSTGQRSKIEVEALEAMLKKKSEKAKGKSEKARNWQSHQSSDAPDASGDDSQS